MVGRMCYAVPAKVVRVKGDTGVVDFGDGMEREVVMAMVDAKEGDYVLVHAGFAIQVIDEEEALKTLRLYREMIESGVPPDE